MKVLLIQLPVQSLDYEYSRENIPLAAGYLKSFAAGAVAEIEICPPTVASLAGDAAIIEWVVERRPDLVGFGAYLWNSERILHLCRAIRARLPQCRLLLGGPEVNPDNAWLLEQGGFDFGIVGEGEGSFAALLRALVAGQAEAPGLLVQDQTGYRHTGPSQLLPELDLVASPYLQGLIGPSFNSSINLETVRGCPYSCSYCYYPKAFRGLRAFGRARLAAEFDWASDQGVSEVNILDPCFARRPDVLELLSGLKDRGLNLNCELNAEDLTPELVTALASGGLKQVEIGLQTTNPVALKHIRRPFNPERFARGVELLRASGVNVMTDVMLGLPGDSLDDVKRTIDFVVERGLYDSLGVYPLAVLPGTRLRLEASELGLDYSPAPPYLLKSGPLMGKAEIEAAFDYASQMTATDYQPVTAPWQSPRAGAYVATIEFAGGGWPQVSPAELGQALSLVISAPDWPERINELASRLAPCIHANPFTLLALVIDEACYNLAALADLMAIFEGRQAPPVYLRCRLTGHGWAYVLLAEGPELWCGLPPTAREKEEDELSRRVPACLERAAALVFHDLAPQAEF